MKRIAGFFLAVCLLLAAVPAWAQHQAYISGNLGFGFRPDGDISISSAPFENDPALVFTGAIGMELNPNIRVEGEIGYRLNTADQGNTGNDWTFRTLSFMGNGYFDIPTNSPLRPYVGAGVGLATIELEVDSGGSTSSDNDLVTAFQLMAGVGFDFSPKATFTFGYRYFTTSNPQYDGFTTEYTSHDFLFGARFRF